MASAQLKIGGMTCQGCVRSVTKKLTGVAGVSSADVNLEKGSASVEYDDGQTTAPALIAAVQQIGFTAAEA